MNRVITLDSGLSAPYEFRIRIWCRDTSGDHGWDHEGTWLGDREVADSNIPEAVWTEFERLADEMAGDNSVEAYQDYFIDRASRAYDEWKDRGQA